ncbi:MAG: protease modulator HflK, partial [Thioalkalispiraceae bacterium]
MAWNEPGGSGNKDPWGNRKDDQGPPDLDEVLKKMQDKLGGLFGGKGGARPTKSGGGSSIGLSFIVLVLVTVWALSGIYIIDEGKQGVVLRLGGFNRITEPGPHWYPRFVEKVEIVDVEQVRSVNLGTGARDSLMLTQDENIVDIQFAVQYKVKDARDYLFNVRDPDATLRQATESAMREI